jgi:hypothetical protein
VEKASTTLRLAPACLISAHLITLNRAILRKTWAKRVVVLAWLMTAGFVPLAASVLAATHDSRCDLDDRYGGRIDEILPGIPTSAWPSFFNNPWSKEEMAAASWFPLGALTQAAKSVPNDIPFAEQPPIENYTPLADADDAATADYREAAELYRHKGFDEATKLFDKIAASKSPYRAAAAYTAARASFYQGHFEDGFARIARLVSDPAMHEFHLAAYHLVGTLANQSGAPPIVAARFAFISHTLIAPQELLCRDERLRNLVSEAHQDLGHILQSTFPDGLYYSAWSAHARQILDTLAARDPVLDLIRVLSAPTLFHKSYGNHPGPDYGWIETFPPPWTVSTDYYDRNGDARETAQQDAQALTDHARDQWRRTRNLLWAYALAIRTDSPDDLSLFDDMQSAVASLPKTDALAGPVLALRRQLIGQQARLLLMAGRMDEALRLLRADDVWHGNYVAPTQTTARVGDDIASFILDGGARYLIEKRDLDAARRWAEELQNMLGPSLLYGRSVHASLSLLLARDWEEFVDIAGKERWHERGGAALDLLPAQKLISLSQRAGLPLDYRRALLSAGWVRLYLLRRWGEFLDAIPLVRRDFPEFATDLDEITGAWTDGTRHHLATRLLLRAPGLSPRVLWARRPGPRDRDDHQADLFSIDSRDPSDGNWWCPIDIDRAKADLLVDYFVGPLEGGRAWFHGTSSLRMFEDTRGDQDEARLIADIDALIAWHPLLKDLDLAELKQLSAIESGPRQLTEEAIAWADESHWYTRMLGLDGHLPETLNLAVRSTRYGCRIAGGHGAYSRRAYIAVHELFPDSEWAKKTPYWFDRP